MNPTPAFVNALLCLKAILAGLKAGDTVVETQLHFPEQPRKREYDIRFLKRIMRDYIHTGGIKISRRNVATIKLNHINKNTPIEYYDAGNYPAI